MFEPSPLVPNLNKTMEEYAKREEETVQATQADINRKEKELKKLKQRLSNQLKKPQRENEELKKLELSAEKKRQAI